MFTQVRPLQCEKAQQNSVATIGSELLEVIEADCLWPVRGGRVEGREKEETKHCLFTTSY